MHNGAERCTPSIPLRRHASGAKARQTMPNGANARHHTEKCKTNPPAKTAVSLSPALGVLGVLCGSPSPPRATRRKTAPHRATKSYIFPSRRKTKPLWRSALGDLGPLAFIPLSRPRTFQIL